MTEAAKQQTAADRLKHRLSTGTLGGDQDSRDVEQVIADLHSAYESLEAQQAKFEDCPHTQVLNRDGKSAWNLTCGCSHDRPDDVCALHAPQLRKALAALAQKTGECERLQAGFDGLCSAHADLGEKAASLEAQVEQLGRQVAELSKPMTDEE